MADVLGRRSFIGRGAELARLQAALVTTIQRHSGQTVVVGGEAGIGKSRLVARFVDEAAAAARVLEGACLELAEDALPYAPFVEILRELVRETPPERQPALFGPARAELARLLPELALRAANLGPSLTLDRASQARLFELLLGVFERLAADRALVVVIEDVHWADRSTRDLIDFLARALRDARVLLVLTTRTDATGAAIGNMAFLGELEREDEVTRIELRPFDRDEVAEQAASLLDEPPGPAAIDRLLARSDGNPFYVEELILARDPDGGALPPVLRDVLSARIGGLSSPAHDILRAAAAAGRQIDDELLAVALGMPARELAAGLREAVASGILIRVESPDGPVYQFRHALLHEVVDRELFAGERAALHAAFAQALEARLAAGDRRISPVEIARHWDGAHQAARALPFMVQAALGAEGVYAFAEAERLWERAAAVVEDLPAGIEVAGRDGAEMLVRGADCAALIGEPRRAAELTQRALLSLYPTDDRDRVLRLENRLRWHHWWSGDRPETLAAVETALTALPPGETVARARVLAQQAGIRMFAGQFEASAASARAAIDIGERRDAITEIALAYGVLGWDLAMLGDIEGGIAQFRRGQAIAEAVGSVEGMAIAATNLAALLDRVGRSEAALEAARAGYALTERFGVARTFGAILLGHAAKAELALGRWDEAERSTSMGLRRGAVDAGAVWLGVNRARLLIGLGRFAEAGVLLRRARGTDSRLGGTDYRTALIAAEAELAAWTGQLADALARGEEGLAVFAATRAPDPSLAWLAALVLRTIGDARLAGSAGPDGRGGRVAAQIEQALALVLDLPGFATGDRAQALLALLRAEGDRVAGRHDAGRWQAVAARWAALQRPFQVAYAKLREAEATIAGRGARPDAAAALAEAAAIATGLGAAPLSELVGRLARQARIALPALDAAAGPGVTQGARAGTASAAPATSARDPFDLTAREAEVLRLVAAGWTNQQIADALVITRKTASVHVSNIMSKLGAANRGEAAALAHRLGMIDGAPLPVGHSG